jgi:hypothetical protein
MRVEEPTLSMVATLRSARSRSGESLPRAFHRPLNSSISAISLTAFGTSCPDFTPDNARFYPINFHLCGMLQFSPGALTPSPRRGERLSRQLHHQIEQHLRAGNEVGRLGVFLDVVAEPRDGGHEDHRGGAEALHHLGVVAGTGGHSARGE